MKILKLFCLVLLCAMFVSCSKPAYTSFETSRVKMANMELLASFSILEYDNLRKELDENTEQTLKNKGLIDYGRQYYANNKNIQINQYKIATSEGAMIIKNEADGTIMTFNEYAGLSISYNKQYLGICDMGKLHIFDLDNNLYEIEHYKNKKCTAIYFSLDNKYLIVNNENKGQIYDVKTGDLVYDNPKRRLFVPRTELFYTNAANEFAMAGNEIILLDEGKRIIVEGLNSGSFYGYIIYVIKNKESVDVLIENIQKTWVPFTSFPPIYSKRKLQELP